MFRKIGTVVPVANATISVQFLKKLNKAVATDKIVSAVIYIQPQFINHPKIHQTIKDCGFTIGVDVEDIFFVKGKAIDILKVSKLHWVKQIFEDGPVYALESSADQRKPRSP